LAAFPAARPLRVPLAFFQEISNFCLQTEVDTTAAAASKCPMLLRLLSCLFLPASAAAVSKLRLTTANSQIELDSGTAQPFLISKSLFAATESRLLTLEGSLSSLEGVCVCV